MSSPESNPDSVWAVASRFSKRFDWVGLSVAGTELVANLIANSEQIGVSAARDFSQVRRDTHAIVVAARHEVEVLKTDIQTKIQASPRFLRVLRVVIQGYARYQLAVARANRRSLDRGNNSCGTQIIERAHQRTAQELCALCIELGGGILKLGQLLSSRPDLLPMPYIDELRTLQDDVPSRPFSELKAVLDTELGCPSERFFASIEAEAIAAASLAQVHKAILLDGTQVAIKIQLPGVDNLIRADLSLIAMLASMFSSSIPQLDWETATQELKRFLNEELDYKREAIRLAQFAEFANCDQRWSVPSVYPKLSSERVLVMSLVEGISLGDVLASSQDPSEINHLLSLHVELTIDHVLVRGLAHGDPHPGNLMVDQDGGLVLVDFGCVLELSAKERSAYVTLIMAVLAHQPKAIASALDDAGFSAQSPEEMVELATLFLEAFSRRDPGLSWQSIDPSLQIEHALGLQRNTGKVMVPSSFILISRGLALVGGLLFHYRPAVDLPHLLMAGIKRAKYHP